jgi:hypothetical protein
MTVLAKTFTTTLFLLACISGIGAAQKSEFIRIDRRLHWISFDRRDTVALREGDNWNQISVFHGWIKEEGVLRDLIVQSERHIRSAGVAVELKPCGVADAFYQARLHHITLCTELLFDVWKLFKADGEAVAFIPAMEATRFFFAHELGHALIARWKLPITGEEEEAADQFALWLLTEDSDWMAMMSGSSVFLAWAMDEERTLKNVTDPHGLAVQRAHRIDCWLSAFPQTRPDRRASPQSAAFLSEQDERRCAETVPRAQAAWDELLTDYRAPKKRPRK